MSQLAVFSHISSVIDGLLYSLFSYSPKPIRCLRLFFRARLYMRKRPFEIEGEVQVLWILTLRYDVAYEGATVEIVKINLQVQKSI